MLNQFNGKVCRRFHFYFGWMCVYRICLNDRINIHNGMMMNWHIHSTGPLGLVCIHPEAITFTVAHAQWIQPIMVWNSINKQTLNYVSDCFFHLIHSNQWNTCYSCLLCSLEGPAIAFSGTTEIEIEFEALFAAVSLDYGDWGRVWWRMICDVILSGWWMTYSPLQLLVLVEGMQNLNIIPIKFITLYQYFHLNEFLSLKKLIELIFQVLQSMLVRWLIVKQSTHLLTSPFLYSPERVGGANDCIQAWIEYCARNAIIEWKVYLISNITLISIVS